MGSLIIREVIKDLIPKGIKQAKVIMLAGTRSVSFFTVFHKQHVNGLHLSSTFLTSGHIKRWTILPIHAHIHTLTVESTTQGDSQLVRSSQGEVPCSGTPRHLL